MLWMGKDGSGAQKEPIQFDCVSGQKGAYPGISQEIIIDNRS